MAHKNGDGFAAALGGGAKQAGDVAAGFRRAHASRPRKTCDDSAQRKRERGRTRDAPPRDRWARVHFAPFGGMIMKHFFLTIFDLPIKKRKTFSKLLM